jgi:hypothetical protein
MAAAAKARFPTLFHSHPLMDWAPVATLNGGTYVSCPGCLGRILDDDDVTVGSSSLRCPTCSLCFAIGCMLDNGGCDYCTYYPVVYIKKGTEGDLLRSPTELGLTDAALRAEYDEVCFCETHIRYLLLRARVLALEKDKVG